MLSCLGCQHPLVVERTFGSTPARSRLPGGATPSPSVSSLEAMIVALTPHFKELKPARPGQWLASYRAPGQTFGQYVELRPARPNAVLRVIYVQPIGEFNATWRKILRHTADFLERYFCLTVKLARPIPLSVPFYAKRGWGLGVRPQVYIDYLLESVLRPMRPKDSFGLIGITPADISPGTGFLLGMASHYHRVGVVSTYRLGDPDSGKLGYRHALLRMLKITTHELGHIFHIEHCLKHCNMNQEEQDRRPGRHVPRVRGQDLLGHRL
jgi:archaemetzincin